MSSSKLRKTLPFALVFLWFAAEAQIAGLCSTWRRASAPHYSFPSPNNFTVLYSFTGINECTPLGVTGDSAGNLYGTAGLIYGVIWKFSP